MLDRPIVVSMTGLIEPPMIAVIEPRRSVPKATSDGSANYEFGGGPQNLDSVVSSESDTDVQSEGFTPNHVNSVQSLKVGFEHSSI
jgi:hypothetical protein